MSYRRETAKASAAITHSGASQGTPAGRSAHLAHDVGELPDIPCLPREYPASDSSTELGMLSTGWD